MISEHKLAMGKRELAERSKAAEKLKLDINTLREERTMLKNQVNYLFRLRNESLKQKGTPELIGKI